MELYFHCFTLCAQLNTEKILPWSEWFVLFHRTAKKLEESRYWPATKEGTRQLYMLVNCFYFRALDEQSFEARMERVGQLDKYCGGTTVIKCEGRCCSFSFHLKGMNQIDFVRRAPSKSVMPKYCFLVLLSYISAKFARISSKQNIPWEFYVLKAVLMNNLGFWPDEIC